MDPLPRGSVDMTHPALTARVGKAGGGCVIPPPTRKPPPRWAKGISVTTRCAGLARSGASLALTGAASAHSVGLASASGSLLNRPYVAPFVVGVADADPLLSEVSSNEKEAR